MTNRSFTLATSCAAWAACLLPVMAMAQQRVDIQLNRIDDGSDQVLLIAEQDFDGLISNLVLTLAWDSTQCLQDPVLRQSAEQSMVLPLSPSGPAFSNGGMKFRKYTGVGLVPLHESAVRLLAAKSLCIARIEGEAGCAASISAEPWLRERRHNGAYYVSLNGLDKTGRVIAPAAGAVPAEGPAVAVSPNPYSGGPLSYSIHAGAAGNASMTLEDSQGRRVGEWPITVRQGSNTGTISPASLAAGRYTVRVALHGRDATVPLAVMAR